VAGAITAGPGGWRLYWVVMTVVAVMIAIMCALFIREPPGVPQRTTGSAAIPAVSWGYKTFLATPQFVILAAAMVGTQLCIVTVAAVTVPHFVNLGWSEEYAARIMGLQGLVGSLATGIFGWVLERHEPKLILAAALLLEAAGTLLLAFAHNVWTVYAFVLVYGIGWSVTSLAATVLLIRYFGVRAGTAALSMVWMLAGVTTAGPSIAGFVADSTGSFVVVLCVLGLVLVPAAVAALFMQGTARAVSGVLAPHLQIE
jgi:MFS family permease